MACTLLQSCIRTKDLATGRRVQNLVVQSGLNSIAVFADYLVRLFASCGSLFEANQTFSNVAEPSNYTWAAIISAHLKLGQSEIALSLYHKMQADLNLNLYVYVAVLKACAVTESLAEARFIHDNVIKSGSESITIVGNTLVDMYAKCGSLIEAQKVFDKMQIKDVVSWGAMIAGFVQHGLGLLAVGHFEKMLRNGIIPNKVIFSSAIKACSQVGARDQGRIIHGQMITNSVEIDVIVGTTLVDMYAKCRSLEEAHNIFDRLPNRNVVSWAAMITGYARFNCGFTALNLYGQMQQGGIRPDRVTYIGILKACSTIGSIEQGRFINNQVIDSGLEWDTVLGNTIIDMYAKCGCLMEARKVFDKLQTKDVASWGAIITGYTHHGDGLSALELFANIQQEGLKPNETIYAGTLKACGSIGLIRQGRIIHDQMIKSGYDYGIVVGSTLVDMYAKCGSLHEARRVFDELTDRDAAAWGAMISGYAHHGLGLCALELFEKMQEEGIKPEKETLLSSLKACGGMGAIEQGRLIHNHVFDNRFNVDLILGNSFIDMYVKCGSMKEAHEVCNRLPSQDVVSWSTLIAGYAQSGNVKLAQKCLYDMELKGIKPDNVLFTSMLAACSHAGLVGEGHLYLKSMLEEHDISPCESHYNCVVDLLGRAGYLNEAEGLLKGIHVGIVGWMSLISACSTYGNVELGRRCFNQLIFLDSNNSSAYVLMSKIYRDAGMWVSAEKFEMLRKIACAWKKPARAWIEVNNQVHEFTVGDKCHPESDEIYATLRTLNEQIKEQRYLAHQTPENDNDSHCGHCERLAVAYGLISTPQGTTIRATKNIRVCVDCHNTIKVISKIKHRDIIIRDAYRIHHFRDGTCSCVDYV